jgi:heme exporter protein C
MSERRRLTIGAADVTTLIVLVLGTLLGAWGLHVGLDVAPIEAELKMTQKIFYLHAPLGIWTIIATIVAALAAAHCLWRRSVRADLLSASCMEVSLVTCGVVLITGSLWAKPAWGEWFPWGEPRVTGMLVLFLIALVYRILRASVDEEGQRARFSAVFAIMGALVAIFAYSAIHIWNTTHPRVISPAGIGLQEDMLRAFLLCVGSTFCITFALVQSRYRLACLEHAIERLEHEVDEASCRAESA